MPSMVIVAGPNGSGKTTVMRRLQTRGFELGEYINADDLAAAMPPHPDRDRLAQEEALRMRRDCMRRLVDFSFETVMSHPSRIDEMWAARASGYRVTLIFIGTEDPSINIARVAQRVRLGGHDVPPERIAARYQRTMALLPAAILASHRALIFDNSDPLAGHRLIVTIDEIDQQKRIHLRSDRCQWVRIHLLVASEDGSGVSLRTPIQPE